MTAEIFLLRHGETAWNAEHSLQGHKDSPLTSRGREQAHIAGEILSRYLGRRHEIPMAVSPLGRARETAAIVQNHAERTHVTIEPRIEEVGFGVWEGLTKAEIDAGWPGLTGGLASP